MRLDCRSAMISLVLAPAIGLCQSRTPVAQGPSLVKPELSRVTFIKFRATALEAITAIALQTHQPIGIVLGRDQTTLCTEQFPFDIHDEDGREALLAVGERMHAVVREEDGVALMVAPDITPHQEAVLAYRFEAFKPGLKQTAHLLTAQLSGWLWMAAEHGDGYGWSMLDSTDAVTFALPATLENMTAEEIADKVITASGGWPVDCENQPRRRLRSHGRHDQLLSLRQPCGVEA